MLPRQPLRYVLADDPGFDWCALYVTSFGEMRIELNGARHLDPCHACVLIANHLSTST